MKRGIIYAIAAYSCWGILPIYWKIIQHVPALEIVTHRVIWTFLFVLIVVWIKNDIHQIWSALKNRNVILTYLISGSLLFMNWLVYIWAVNAGFVVDSSLGYFINPLINVVLGVLFLREKLRLGQWIPVGIAALGVLYLTISFGSLPWIGLILALTFGFYGLLKKTAPLNSISGFTLEIGFLFIPALLTLFAFSFLERGSFQIHDPIGSLLLILTGVATGIPLLLFGAAARIIPLSTLGFIQYIAPSMQFLIGVFVFHESLTIDRLIGFGFIWVALLFFSIDNIKTRNNKQTAMA